jgi:hypothetical protein
MYYYHEDQEHPPPKTALAAIGSIYISSILWEAPPAIEFAGFEYMGAC